MIRSLTIFVILILLLVQPVHAWNLPDRFHTKMVSVYVLCPDTSVQYQCKARKHVNELDSFSQNTFVALSIIGGAVGGVISLVAPRRIALPHGGELRRKIALESRDFGGRALFVRYTWMP